MLNYGTSVIGWHPTSYLLTLKNLTLYYFTLTRRELVITLTLAFSITWKIDSLVFRLTIVYKDYIKYLGVMIDKNLSWKFHIDAVANKIIEIVGLIGKLHHFTLRRVLLNIYQALIQPYLTYGLASWGQLSKAHSIPLFTDANVLPLMFLYYESVSNSMHDVNNNYTLLNILKFL